MREFSVHPCTTAGSIHLQSIQLSYMDVNNRPEDSDMREIIRFSLSLSVSLCLSLSPAPTRSYFMNEVLIYIT